MDDALRVDSENVAIEGEVMHRPQRQAVDDCGDALRVGVRRDVCGLDD